MSGPIRDAADYYQPGDWNAVCSMCGTKKKASELVKNWQGFYRCPEHNEPRHPQDFVRGAADIQTVAWSQPEQEIFISLCTLNGRSGFPGWAYPGCMLPGNRVIDSALSI